MSEKRNKKFRQIARKTFKTGYREFLELTEELEWKDRFKIAWAVLWKLGTVEKRRRAKMIKKRQEILKASRLKKEKK